MNERLDNIEQTIHYLIRFLAQTATSENVSHDLMRLCTAFDEARYYAAKDNKRLGNER